MDCFPLEKIIRLPSLDILGVFFTPKRKNPHERCALNTIHVYCQMEQLSQNRAAFRSKGGPGVLTLSTEKPGIPVGKSNGSHHSIWKASEIMGCQLG